MAELRSAEPVATLHHASPSCTRPLLLALCCCVQRLRLSRGGLSCDAGQHEVCRAEQSREQSADSISEQHQRASAARSVVHIWETLSLVSAVRLLGFSSSACYGQALPAHACHFLAQAPPARRCQPRPLVDSMAQFSPRVNPSQLPVLLHPSQCRLQLRCTNRGDRESYARRLLSQHFSLSGTR